MDGLCERDLCDGTTSCLQITQYRCLENSCLQRREQKKSRESAESGVSHSEWSALSTSELSIRICSGVYAFGGMDGVGEGGAGLSVESVETPEGGIVLLVVTPVGVG